MLVRLRRGDGHRLVLPGPRDKAAESAVISVESSGVPRFLIQYGHGPEGKSPRREVDRWRSKGKRGGDAS